MKHLLAVAIVLGSANALLADDDDDNGVGLYVNGDFELSQGLVFGPTDAVRAWNDANLSVTGGEIRGGIENSTLGDGIDVNHSANVTISRGDIRATDDAIKAKANATVGVSGGIISGDDDGISAVADSSIQISGGEITGGSHGVSGIERARFRLSGGTINGPVSLLGESSMTFSGGTVNGPIRLADYSTLNLLSGPGAGFIEVDDSAHINIFLDPETNSLLDGSSLDRRIIRSEIHEDVRISTYSAVTEDRTISNADRSLLYGVVKGGESPTRVTVENVDQIGLYLLDDSEVIVNGGGLQSGVIADDTSRLTIVDGDFGAYQREGVLARGTSVVDIRGGVFRGYTHGIQLRGRSQTHIAAGTFEGGNRDGIHMKSFADVRISSGEIHGSDEGIRASDNSNIVFRDGTISGDSNGISISESTQLSIRGGSIDGKENGLRMRDNTRVDMTGGTIGNRLLAENSSRFEMLGGEVNGDIIARKSADIKILGGMIKDDIRISDQAELLMSGGNVSGRLKAQDASDLLVNAGTIVGGILAEDSSRVRIIGNDLLITDGRLGGSLMDGSSVQGEVRSNDDALIVLFEGLGDRAVITGPLTKQNYAVSDGGGMESVVEFRPGTELAGGLSLFKGGRANFLGGSFANPIQVEPESILAFYGSDHEYSVEFDDGQLTGTVSGEDISGNRVQYELEGQFDGIRFFDVVKENAMLGDGGITSVAIFDGSGGPSVVELERARFLQSAEVFDHSTMNSRGHVQSGFEAIGIWNQGTLNILDGFATSYGSDAIAANDSGTVNMSGGNVRSYARDGIRAWNKSRLDISGGSITAADDGIDLSDTVTLQITGGAINADDDAIKAKGASSVVIAGGILNGTDDGVSLANDSAAVIFGAATQISGGTNGVLAIDNAVVEIRDGTFGGSSAAVRSQDSSVVHIFGGTFEEPIVADGGQISIIGSNLSIDDNGVVTGELLEFTPVQWQTNSLGLGNVSILNTYPGDSNMDGEFSSLDLVTVFGANEYEDDVELNSTWREGDWNGDGDFDTTDLVFAFNIGGYEQGPRIAAASVPEPSAVVLCCIGIGALSMVRRRRGW